LSQSDPAGRIGGMTDNPMAADVGLNFALSNRRLLPNRTKNLFFLEIPRIHRARQLCEKALAPRSRRQWIDPPQGIAF
jgi:hypothetical protein